MTLSETQWVTKEEFNRAIYGANGSIGLAESLRTVNAWIVAYELRRTKEGRERSLWSHAVVQMIGGALIAIAGVAADRLLFK